MGETTFHQEDRIGLGAAIVLHLLLVAVIAMQALFAPAPTPAPSRIAVSLSSEVSLEATAPEPVPESRAAIAPTLSDVPTPPVEETPDAATPDATPPQPQPQPQPRPQPRTTQRQTPTPPDTRDRRRPEPSRAEPAPARSASRGGGSRIGDNFLDGQGASTRTDETRAPAANFGSRERAALGSAITRQLRPHWNAPSGVDAEKLVSTVSWNLNRDGSLRGRPTCRTDPASITESNRPQAGLHCERAIRAVQLAAPFNLPDQFYSRWDDLEWQFDRRL